MYGVGEKYVRLQEYPFSSEQKMMAVKCVPKYSDVSTIFSLGFRSYKSPFRKEDSNPPFPLPSPKKEKLALKTTLAQVNLEALAIKVKRLLKYYW